MTLETWIAVVIVMFVAAVTPGPNNLLAMRSGTRGRAAFVRVVVGVVIGSIAVLAVALLGGAMVFQLVPALRSVLAVVGAAYLAWLGVSISVTRATEDAAGADRSSVGAVLALQLVNPKSWLLALAIAAMPGTRGMLAFGEIAVLCLAIPACCLSIWAGVGALLSRGLAHRRTRAWFNGITGGLFVASSIALLMELR